MLKFERIHPNLVLAATTSLAAAHPIMAHANHPNTSVAPATHADGQREFDFELGTWKTHLKRRLRPLSGSKLWLDYNGTTSVRPIWNSRGNLVELEVDGPGGHIEALSLRLYNQDSRQWSLNFANSSVGTITTPSIGSIHDGRGEFIDQERFGERNILVRFSISKVSSTACHFEQSFSDDGGKTWEVNWIADDTLISRSTLP